MSLIRWSQAARRDYRDIVEWLSDRNPGAAARMAEAIERRVGRLAEMPRLGRTGRVEGTRELVIPDTPFLAVYELEGDQESVVILRILHSARRWPGPAR